MIGTGFIKCIPITMSGLEVTAPICVIEIEDVFDARIVSFPQASSNCLNILSFKSMFSVAASTTKLASLTPAVISVKVVILSSVAFLSSSEIRSLDTILSKFLAIVSIPRLREASLISINCTLNPD